MSLEVEPVCQKAFKITNLFKEKKKKSAYRSRKK